MSKPIFIIRFPESLESKEKYYEMLEHLDRRMRDYHVFGFSDNKTDRIEFECYNPETSSEISMQELEQRILTLLK